MPRTDASFPVMREKLSLVCSHIDIHGTIAFAAFAGEAEVERLFHALIAPAFGDHIAMQHLPQMVRAAARGVPLFMRDHEAGTHGIAFGAGRVFSAALSNANAAQRRMGKAAVILRILEMSRRVPWMIAGTEAQILVDAIWIDDLAGIHLPIRVPDGFEFAESFNQLWAEHFVEKLGFGLPVAVFAAEAAAVFHAQVGGLFHEGAPFFYSRSAGQVKADAAVKAALPEVAVHGGVVLIFVIERAQFA